MSPDIRQRRLSPKDSQRPGELELCYLAALLLEGILARLEDRMVRNDAEDKKKRKKAAASATEDGE